MRTISTSRPVSASRAAVWQVLADYPNIANWNGGVTKSFATSDETEGVGATRHCDLKPFGALEETIAEWQPEHRMVINIDSAARLPIDHGAATFTIDGDDAAPTVTVDYSYQPGLGPVGRLIGPLLDRQLTTGFAGFIDDLETEALIRSQA